MRRSIHLYVGEPPQPADLDDQSFILFNWATTDVTEIAQVKNGHSCTVSLPGTPANDQIFGQMHRNDRSTEYDTPYTGIYFDASRRTPFTIYDDASNVLESGYLKLDAVESTLNTHTYKVTLYGGLGSFLYSLAYDAQGNRRTLADLDYKQHGSNVVEDLSFTISAATVKAAWTRLASANMQAWPSDKWDIINFAPAYNGAPRGAFSPEKGIYPSGGFLPATAPGGFVPPNGGSDVLVTFPTKKTEWETRDLRSYLQRPVLRVAALLEALCDPANNGGFTVDASELDPMYNIETQGWITLPLLQDLNLDTQDYNATINITQGASVSLPVSSVPSMRTKYRVKVVPRLYITGATNLMLFSTSFDDPGTFYCNVVRVSCQLWKAGVLQETRYLNAATADVGTETGTYNWTITHNGYLRGATGQGNWVGDEIVFEFDDSEADEIVVNMNYVATADGSGSPISGAVWKGSTLADRLTASSTGGAIYGSATGDVTTASRSFATVTKDKLLSTDYTPADYLLSLCKMLNVRMHYDMDAKTVRLLSDYAYHNDGVKVNLEQRINRGAGVSKTPLQYSARWYEWRAKYDHGDYAKYYANVYGRTYGAERVNTAFEFDANTLEVVDTVLFRGAVQILEPSQYFVDVLSGGTLIPSVFLEGGATYGLVNQEGKVENVPVPSTEYVARSYLNGTYPYYDLFDKAQFHDADNAAYDERDTILMMVGMEDVTGKGYILTDDTKEMMALNNNTPCWHLSLPPGGQTLTAIPHFSRLDGAGMTLDYGIPADVPIPGAAPLYSCIYDRWWDFMIRSQFTPDTPVVRCKVNLDGLQVGPEMLRHTYVFDGAKWHLNKIINYSLTTWDDTECEFIKYE